MCIRDSYDDVRALLREKRINETPEAFHEELAFSLQLLAVDPQAVRYNQRLAVGSKTLGQVSLEDKEALSSLGREILEWRAQRIAQAIR